MKRRIDFLAKPFPTLQEFIFLLFIVVSVTVFVTFIDIMIHDSYVRPIIAECYLENKSEFCEQRRAELINQAFFWLDTNENPQLQLGGTYWFTLLTIPIFVAVILGISRPIWGVMAGAKINPMLFIIGILWGFSVMSLYYFGWLDFLYYFLRDLPIPNTPLNWLDGVGAFTLVQNMGPTTSVDAIDLYHLMGLGLVLLIGVWGFMIHHHKKKTFHRLGLI